MSSVNLRQELSQAIIAIKAQHREKAGIPLMYCGAARVRFRSDGYYDLDPAGVGAIIFPVTDHPSTILGEPYDLVAWRPCTDQIATRKGVATYLGSLEPFLAHHTPIQIHRTVRAWAASSDGIFVLEWDVSLEQLLVSGRTVVAEDVEHGKELERRLRAFQRRLTPSIPSISVRAA